MEENSKSVSEEQLENPDEQEVVVENNLELLKIKSSSSFETDKNTEEKLIDGDVDRMISKSND